VRRGGRAGAAAAAAAVALGLAGCSGCDGGEGGPDAAADAEPISYRDCGSDTPAWVRNAYLAIVGHRPHGQAEVDVYVELHDQIAALRDEGATALDPREVVARAMAGEPAYRSRWTSHFLDALRVPRLDDQSMARCYGRHGGGDAAAGDDGTLARAVREQPASATAPGGAFTLRDLAASAIALDDVTPLYRAHLFALVAFPIPAANVPRIEAELARREDFGATFDSAYLNRDLVCLQCHNSERSVTDAPDPAFDRHWPLPGRFEAALYGDPEGIDPARAHAVFRHDGLVPSRFAPDGPRRPWGWSRDCGTFFASTGADPAGVDGRFGRLTGDRTTVFDLEASLRAGFEGLRGGRLVLGPGGAIDDPDHAFAYLAAASIVEGVWREVIGSGLTIAHYFPRNEPARDVLAALTDRFVASGYSLEDLLVAIVTSDFFSRQLPEEACGEDPYGYPNVYDPWTIGDGDEARRGNGPGDAIAALGARTLLRSAFTALEWEVADDELDFPSGPGVDGAECTGHTCGQLQGYCDFGFCCATYQEQCLGVTLYDEVGFQQGIGAFLKNGDRGFRGLDFQARLVWEDRLGVCARPSPEPDFVDRLIEAAQADGGATLREVIVALKDRVIGEPTIETGAEAAALAALFGGSLDRAVGAVADLEEGLRRTCGVLLGAPQFVLAGAAGRGGEVPRLTPPAWRFEAVCGELAARLADLTGGALEVGCAGGPLTVSAPGAP
jgi:hypothetical protein